MKKWRFAVLFLNLFIVLALFPGSWEASQDVSQGIYQLACKADPDFVLEVRSCTRQEEEEGDHSRRALQLYRCLDVNQQKFYFEKLTASRFRISSLVSGKFLTANEDGTVTMEELSGDPQGEASASQVWIIRKNPDGSVLLQSPRGGCLTYLTESDARPWNGAEILLSQSTRAASQSWVLCQTLISSQAEADTDLINPFAPGGPYENCSLSMRFGSSKETLRASQIASWLTETDEHTFTGLEEGFFAYAQSLAEKYDTQGHARNFRTSYGSTITLYQGNFGWKLDVNKTAAMLMEEARSHAPRSVSPLWSHQGVSFLRGDDIGDSYVEIDLTNQKVWLYRNGEQILETDCVTGTFGTDRQTPGGVYSIFYMQSPAVLRGEDYASPVEYWMAFNGGIGLHDADWRSEFGGEIYKSDGSHGCVNLPSDAAKKIYETVSIGYPVVCYN